jgi:uncharacterized membrane protein
VGFRLFCTSIPVAEGLKFQTFSSTTSRWSREYRPVITLIPCDACDADISPKALSCPHCGHPTEAASEDAGRPTRALARASDERRSEAASARTNLNHAHAEYLRLQSLRTAQGMMEPKTSGLAMVSLACVIGGLLSAVVINVAAIVPVAIGIIVGHISLKEIRLLGGRKSGASLAITALFLGYGTLGLIALIALALLLAIMAHR